MQHGHSIGVNSCHTVSDIKSSGGKIPSGVKVITFCTMTLYGQDWFKSSLFMCWIKFMSQKMHFDSVCTCTCMIIFAGDNSRIM
jgi:hypothetical protein